MTRPAEPPHAPNPVPAAGPALPRAAAALLLAAVGGLLAVVICTPIALSSHDLINWAAAPTGLALPAPWPVLVFLALDAAAGVCVLLTVYCAWRGEPPGVFAALVWCFAAGSAFANWRHARAPGAPPDAVWFFPAMSLAGPVLLEAVLGRLRRWVQRGAGRRGRATPSFGWRRWTPGIGALRDTYGAYRTALLLGVDTVDAAIATYHHLCPNGSLKVAAALRAHHRHHACPDPPAARFPASSGTAVRRHDARDAAGPPAHLLRRIPADPDAYRRWLSVWADLQRDTADPRGIAGRHGVSLRQLQFVRRAGQAGLLDSPTPPARRAPPPASMAGGRHPDPARAPRPDPARHGGRSNE
jgi:Protein of unknown function (DUF2637)